MLGLRAGFLLGFVAGAAIASLFSESERARSRAAAGGGAAQAARGEMGRFRALAQEAMAAARQAAEEKEREMRRQFEAATHRR